MLLTLALAPWATNLLILVLLGVAVLLILTVLIQRPQGGGLSAAFGSSGSGQTAFGTKTGDALTVFTVVMFTVFVFAAIGLNFGMRPASEVPGQGVIEGTSDGAVPATGGGAGQPITQPTTPPTATPGDQPVEQTPAGTAPGQPATGVTPPVAPPAEPGALPAPQNPVPSEPAPTTPPAPGTEEKPK